jgi:hypothetical protein
MREHVFGSTPARDLLERTARILEIREHEFFR